MLILKSTLWNPADPSANPEVQAAVGLGKTVEVTDDTQWGSKTAAQFASYDAIILGDPNCPESGAHSILGAAEANTTVWGPRIKGNVVIVASDPT